MPTTEAPTDGPISAVDGLFRRAVIVSIAAAVLLRVDVLRLPFILDDFLQMAMRTGAGWVARPPWDRFRLVSGAADEVRALVADGRLPWWSDPGVRIAPFRPLSSLEGALGYSLHGNNPLAAHAVSLGWLVLLVGSVALFLRSALPSRAAALAALAYALSRTHGMTVAWIANRCALISGVFVALSLHGYVRWRKGSGPGAWWQFLLCLGLSLLSSEYAIGAFGFLLAYELFEARDSVPRRVRALLPALGLGLLYALAFRWSGHGGRGTALYTDPVTAPVRFAKSVAINGAELLTLAFAPVPGLAPSPTTRAVGIANGILFAWLILAVPAGPGCKKARWICAGALLAIVPVSSTWPQYRLLVLPEIGIAAGVGAIISDAVAPAPAIRRIVAAWLALVHLALAPVATVLDIRDLRVHEFFERAAIAAPIPQDPTADTVLLGTTNVFAMHYPLIVRRLSGIRVPKSWRVLSCTPGAVEVRRTGPEELELRALGSGLLDSPQASVYRDSPRELVPNTEVRAGDFRATVLSAGAAGPRHVRFHFPEPLDDPRLVLLVVGPFGFVRLNAPPLGAAFVVPGG